MKSAVQVFFEGAVITDVVGLEFGVPRGVAGALGHILVNFNENDKVDLGTLAFTHGRPSPLAGILLPMPEVFEGAAQGVDTIDKWRATASQKELESNEDGELFVYFIETGEEDKLAVTFGDSNPSTPDEGSYSAFYLAPSEFVELGEALLACDYDNAPSQNGEEEDEDDAE